VEQVGKDLFTGEIENKHKFPVKSPKWRGSFGGIGLVEMLKTMWWTALKNYNSTCLPLTKI